PSTRKHVASRNVLSSSTIRKSMLIAFAFIIGPGQPQSECCAHAGFADKCQPPVHHLDKFAHDAQPQTGRRFAAGGPRGQTTVTSEHSCLIFRRKTRAFV